MGLFSKSRFNMRARKGIVSFLVFALVSFSVLLPAGNAHAQLAVADPSQATATALGINKDIQASLGAALTAASLGALMQGVSYFTRKLAYDAAVSLAYADKGSGPLGYDTDWGEYFGQVAGDSLATTIGELGKPFGLDLCSVPNLQMQLFLQLGIPSIFGEQGPQPTCTWQRLTEGGIFDGDAWYERYGTAEGRDETFSASLSVTNSDFGVGLGAIAAVDRNRAAASESRLLERLAGNGFKDVKRLISNDVKTPASLVQENAKQLSDTHQGQITAGQVAGLYASTDVLTAVAASASSVFLNTLTSTMLNRLIDGIFAPSSGRGSSGVVLSPFADADFTSAQKEFQKPLRELLSRAPGRIDDYDPVAAWAACPDNPGLNNCVIDAQLQQLLVRSKFGGERPLTIAEAIEEGFLDPNKPLISPRSSIHLDKNRCQNDAYCYSNLQKLRKLRVLPLGFEIAALRSSPDNPWKLGEVVEGFHKCDYLDPENPSAVNPSDQFPFCHLINPNWVIIVPPATCEAKVYGPELARQDASFRREECVDVTTCLQRDAKGNCVSNAFGYCTQESNTWQIEGTSCPAHYATCRTYTNQASKQVDSYLTRTVDFGECTQETVGCRAYATDRVAKDNDDAAWLASARIGSTAIAERQVGNNQVLYFDDEIEAASRNCGAGDDGCTAFKLAQRAEGSGPFDKDADDQYIPTNNLEYLKKAPDYLGCYDINLDEPGNQWPATQLELEIAVSNNPACEGFAGVCIASEVGCRAYEPVDGGPTIPGIVGDENTCVEACVGYDTYKQLGVEDVGKGFEESQFPLYFVPNIAKENMRNRGLSCSEESVGCDEFTNLDAQNQGGERLEYYNKIKYCERPSGDNLSAYFTWEGSAEQGFVLRTHELRPTDNADIDYYNQVFQGQAQPLLVAGSPRYATDQVSELLSLAEECNEERYEIRIADANNVNAAPTGCKAIFDNEGNVYYRMVDQLVTVSPSCKFLRKTRTDLVVDQAVQDPGICVARGGKWEDGCVRCAAGGRLQGDVCVYAAMTGPGESSQCSAQANGCRAYTGNQSGNTQDMFPDIDADFEASLDNADEIAEALMHWFPQEDIAISNEATDRDLHSLEVNAGVAGYSFVSSTGEFTNNTFYTVSFWAKGTGQNLSIFLSQDGAVSLPGGVFTQAASVGQTWRRYEFGPIEVSGIDAEEPVQLVFNQGNGNSYFLDHVRLRRVAEVEYLVKDSWKTVDPARGVLVDVPLACDGDHPADDPFDGLPGQALGCRAYESNGDRFYATGFDSLCREAAIGCEPVWDTFNTIDGDDPEGAHVYNAICRGNSGEACAIEHNGQPLAEPCQIPVGQDHCYIPHIVMPDGLELEDLQQDHVDRSTIFIPADTPTSTPLFLTNTELTRCKSGANGLGCLYVGQETQVLPTPSAGHGNNPDLIQRRFEHADRYVKNDPRLYGETTCVEEVVACSEFTHEGGVSFFKDPGITGSQHCTYVQEPNAQGQFGWYMNDIGRCSGNGRQCTNDAQCDGGTCLNKGASVLCSPDNPQRGGYFDIWSSGSQNYDGFVGVCPAQYDTCTEFIDHADTSNLHEDGKPYYYLFNKAFRDNLSECDGVSLNEGCILLDKTDEPNKLYNTKASYIASEQKEGDVYGFVEPVRQTNGDGAVDANLLLKVRRDRECTEWLSCKTSSPVIDPETGDELTLCYNLQACEQLDENGNCSAWVGQTDTPQDVRRATAPLGYNQYINRGVSWFDEEFTGYSLYGKYQATDMTYIAFHGSPELEARLEDEFKQTYLTRKLTPELAALLQDAGAEGEQIVDFVACVPGDHPGTDSIDEVNWRSCGPGLGGMCFDGECYFPPEGTFRNKVTEFDEARASQLRTKSDQIRLVLNELIGSSCKVLPEGDAPFPYDVINEQAPNRVLEGGTTPGFRTEFVSLDIGYRGANVCQDGNCSCAYDRVEYESGMTDFWPTGLGPQGVCVNADEESEGLPCSLDSHCSGEGASCSQIKKINQHIGIHGFCLEPDYSRPLRQSSNPFACLTWLPTQASVSAGDVYNRYVYAGYHPDLDSVGGGETFCTQGTTDRGVILDPREPWASFDRRNQAENAGHTLREQIDRLRIGEDESWQDIDDEDKANVYASMEYLAVAHHKNNVILRFDLVRDGYAPEGEQNVGGILGTANNPIYVHAFAPTVDDDSNTYPTEYGTIMHPPRLFSNDPIDGYPCAIGSGYSAEAAKVRGCRGGVPFPSAAHYVSPFEQILNEADIERVSFQPYHHRGAGEAPIAVEPGGVGSNQLLLDFHLLRQAGAHAQLVHEQNGGDLDSVVWTYYLTREETQGNAPNLHEFSFTNYDAVEGIDNFDGYDAQRNEIWSRYVLVFSDSNKDGRNMPSFINARLNEAADGYETVGFPDPETKDPFTVGCEDDRNAAPFLAVGMDFNKNGEFLGYIARHCGSERHGNGVGYMLMTSASVYSRCQEARVVHDGQTNLLTSYANKAWTNRVWEGASKFSEGRVVSSDHPRNAYNRVKRDTESAPYGSLPYSALELRADAKAILERSAFVDSDRGIPYECTYPWGAYTGERNRIRVTRGPRAQDAVECQIDPQISGINQAIIDQITSVSREQNSQADIALSRIFAKFMGSRSLRYQITNGGAITYNVEELENGDYAFENGGDGNYPFIYSVNPFTCGINSSNCSAAELGHFTVNGRNMYGGLADYNGDGIADEDLDQDGKVDPIVAVAGYRANMKFFMQADHNRMPIRRVMVNWGDQTIVPRIHNGPVGLYKNHLPVCESSDGSGRSKIGQCEAGGVRLGMTCSIDVGCPDNFECVMPDDDSFDDEQLKKFGHLPRACQQGYYEIEHDYTCSAADIAKDSPNARDPEDREYVRYVRELTPEQRAQVLALAPDATENTAVCAFAPGVQVMDNWGWCNGSCGPNGCYDKTDEPVAKLCSDDQRPAFVQAFTYFGGEANKADAERIIVIPDIPSQ